MPTASHGDTDSETGREADAAAVLLVDDDIELCTMLAEYLGTEGYAVTTVHTGASGLGELDRAHFDIVVLDITMPGMDGFETLRRLRKSSDVPVLMLTARGEDTDRIVGLELGADDYLPKPFNPRELAARLKAILRRAQPGADKAATLRVGDLELDPRAQSAHVGGEPVRLTSAEFGVLEQLARAVGTVVAKAELSEQVLGRRLTPYDRSLDTHIANLRRKLGPGPGDEPRIKTVRGQGYLLVAR